MNKSAHLGLSVLEPSKILMYEFWYDYVKPKYNEKAKLCYMDTDNYKNVAEDVETRFDTSNYELECNSIDRPLPKGKNKKLIVLMKDELGGKIMKRFVEPRAKAYSYLKDDISEDKKAKVIKNVISKENLNLKIIKTVQK